MKRGAGLRRLHPMDAFGVVTGLTHEIRVDRLRDRHDPLIAFPHKHSFHQILLVTRGSGWHEIDFSRHRLGAGTVFAMKPAQVHSWSFSRDVDGFVIEFEEDVLTAPEPVFRAALEGLACLPDAFRLPASERALIVGMAEAMFRDGRARKPGFVVRTQAALVSLILRLAQAPVSPRAVSADPILAGFQNLVEKNFREEHAVDFYARMLRVTPKALTNRVTRATGRSARAWIQERALLEAKRLLAYSDFSVSAVADELGFEDPNYFARFFRTKTGVAPGEFRRNARG